MTSIETTLISDLEGVINLMELDLKNAEILIFDLPIIPQEVCLNNKKVKRVIFTEKVKCISYSAFKGCSNLTNIEFGPNIMRIEGCAFADCPKLACNIIIPTKIMSIGIGAFANSFVRTREAEPAELKSDTEPAELKSDTEPAEPNSFFLFVPRDALQYLPDDKDKQFGLHFDHVDTKIFNRLKLSNEMTIQEKLGYFMQGFVLETLKK
jgi:hypothetical protein